MVFDPLGLGFLYWEWDSKHKVSKKDFFRIKFKQKSNNSAMEFYPITKYMKVNHDDNSLLTLSSLLRAGFFVIVTSPLGAQCTSAIKWSAALLYKQTWQILEL